MEFSGVTLLRFKDRLLRPVFWTGLLNKTDACRPIKAGVYFHLRTVLVHLDIRIPVYTVGIAVSLMHGRSGDSILAPALLSPL